MQIKIGGQYIIVVFLKQRSALRSGRFNPGEKPIYCSVGGLMDPTTGLNDLQKKNNLFYLPRIEPRIA
jgi:hypothetical protein